MTRHAMRYYLGPWQWDDELDAFCPPVGAVGAIDLRGDCTKSGTAFFAAARDLDRDYEYLGDVLDGHLTTAQRAAWKSLVGMESLTSATLLDVLWETLTVAADSVGETHTPPILPTREGQVELYLGGHGFVRREPWLGVADPAWPVVQHRLQADYRNTRQQALAGTTQYEQELHRRMLTVWVAKYKIADYRLFVPADLPDEPPRKAGTSYTESFDGADQDAVGHDLTWTEVAGDWDNVSNEAEFQPYGSGTAGTARAEHDVSSTDHYAEVEIQTVGAGTQETSCGACVRFSAAAETCYIGWVYGANDRLYVSKLVAGTQTNIVSVVITPSLPEIYRIDCSGSTLTCYQAGVLRITQSDGSIGGGTRGGMFAWRKLTGEPKPRFDDWKIDDGIAADQAMPIITAQGIHSAVFGGLVIQG